MAAPKPLRHPYTIIKGDLLSVEEYALLPDEPGWRMELVRGKVVKMPLVKDTRHGWIISRLIQAIRNYLDVHPDLGGEVSSPQEGYDISVPGSGKEGASAVAPDVAYVREEHISLVLEALERGEYPPIAPDLAVEVVSPSQATWREMEERAQMWLAGGTRLVWNIWREEQRIDVWQPDEPMYSLPVGDLLDGQEVLPGFTLPVADLFRFPRRRDGSS